MPDNAIIMNVCLLLNISVNELLSGEKCSEKHYMGRAEENMLELVKETEYHKKKEASDERIFTCMVCDENGAYYNTCSRCIYILHILIKHYWLWNRAILFPIFQHFFQFTRYIQVKQGSSLYHIRIYPENCYTKR